MRPECFRNGPPTEHAPPHIAADSCKTQPALSENKTIETDASVEDFLAGVEHVKRQADARVVVEMMTRITGCPPKMWGENIVGFDTYHYKYDSGREGDFLIVGVAPRKTNLSLHLLRGFKAYPELMAKLGKYKTGVSCLYITQLKNVDLEVLEQLIAANVADMRAAYHK